MSLKESTVQSRESERGGGDLFADALEQLRPFEDDGSAIDRVPARRLERDVHGFRALEGR